jgi:hypothetical protein
MHDVRPPAQAFMPKHCAEDQLHVEHEHGKQRQCDQAGAAAIEFDARLFLDGTASREQSDDHRNAEEGLRERGVG